MLCGQCGDNFDESIKAIEKLAEYTEFRKRIVRYIDPKTGEVRKGPKYDSTEQDLNPKDEALLAKYQTPPNSPIEPMQSEPRDRMEEPTKETSAMNEINKFRNIIRECISEIKQENNPRIRLKESLRNVVKSVLNEMTSRNVPEQTKEEKETSDKMYFKDPNPRLSKSNIKQQKELETIVQGIDPSWEAYWDDHQQLIVKAQNLLYVRICQRFENNYDVDAMVKLVDRIRAIALTWEQVKSFVKANFNDLKNKTIPDTKRDMAIDNYKDQEIIKKDAGPEKAKVKVRYQDPEHGSVKNTKQDDKNYNEPLTKRDEDMPDQPMKKVTEPGKDPESKNKNIKKTPQVKPPKHKNDKTLRVGDKKTSKFVLKKRK